MYSCSQTKFYLKELFFSCDEDVLAKPLARVQMEFPAVQLGSYPDASPRTNYRVRISVESVDRALVEKVSIEVPSWVVYCMMCVQTEHLIVSCM